MEHAWIFIVIGLALLLYYAKTRAVILGFPFLLPVVSLMLIAAPFALGWVEIPTIDVQTGTITTPSVATFDLSHTAGYSCNFNRNTKVLNVPVTVNTTSNTVSPLYASINTSIIVIPPSLAQTTDMAVLYFESDHLMTFDSELILDKTNNNYLAEYTTSNEGEGFCSGQIAMAYTDTDWVNITYTLDSGSNSWVSEVASADLYSTISSWNILFTNKAGWEEMIIVNLIITTINT